MKNLGTLFAFRQQRYVNTIQSLCKAFEGKSPLEGSCGGFLLCL
jgi:hypothetical protein